MMSPTDILALLGHALLLAAVVVWLVRLIWPQRCSIKTPAAAIIVVSLLPLGEMSWAQYSDGIFGDLSIVTIVLLVRYLLYPAAPKQQSRGLFILLAITGLLFYPGALGLGMLDPYRWGYLNTYHGLLGPMLFLALLGLVLLVAYLRRNWLIMLCLVSALIGLQLQLMASRNLWDYLLDPLVVIYALVSVGSHCVRRMFGKRVEVS